MGVQTSKYRHNADIEHTFQLLSRNLYAENVPRDAQNIYSAENGPL